MTDQSDPTFADLGLMPEILATLTELGYEEPTPIQAAAIPEMRRGVDMIGQAATGTGKTAAFALPIIERVHMLAPEEAPSALVLVPTRELAMQVTQAIWQYGNKVGVRVMAMYGGQPIGRQLSALRKGVHVVVATPGRAIDHLNRHSLSLDDVQIVVLDEADEMLDMGFAEDLDTILSSTPEGRQTVLFSATMPPRIAAIAKRHLKSPVRIQIEREATAAGDAPKVRQTAYVVSRAHKPFALGRILDVESPTAAIVFCRTRGEVDDLTDVLNGRGYRAESLHGGLGQEQRDKVMGRVRSGVTQLLIATDVAARGLDIDVLSHVVNYDVPSAPESYVHRIGRVGRAGREGVAITLAEPREQRMLANIERVYGSPLTMAKVPTVGDVVRAKADKTRATVHAAIVSGNVDPFRDVLAKLTEEFDVTDVALAAIKLVHQASVGDVVDTIDIPDLTQGSRERKAPRDRTDRFNDSGPRPSSPFRDKPGSKHRAGPTFKPGGAGKGRKLSDSTSTARVRFGIGKSAGVRPGDLVGAITNEVGLNGKEIGSIFVSDHWSVVEVPESSVQEVISTMSRTTLKGRKATVRLYHDDPK